MNAKDEINFPLKDAGATLKSAEREFKSRDFRATVQNSQTCIELSAKAVISYFSEPEWTHDPGEQLHKILIEKKVELAKKLTSEFLTDLFSLSQDATLVAPWHGFSVYGMVKEDRRYAAVDICTRKIAKDLLAKAKSAFSTANKFVVIISKPR